MTIRRLRFGYKKYNNQYAAPCTRERVEVTLIASDLALNGGFVAYEVADSKDAFLSSVGYSIEDVDTNETPTHAFDLGFGAVDGTISVAVVTGSDKGRAGGEEVVLKPGTNIKGLYLIFKSTAAAATAATGKKIVITLDIDYATNTKTA